MKATAPLAPIPGFFRTEAERREYVGGAFDRSARHYERICGALSLGTGRWYRRQALLRAGLAPGMRVLDVATGTGLVARAALDAGVAARSLVGVDPSEGMLEEGRRRGSFALVRGWGERLPFRDGSFDFVAMGYALRHVEDLEAAFAGFRRVLRPGGRLLVLEHSRPVSRAGRALARLWFRSVVPGLTWLVTREPEARRLMEYYWATIEACVEPGVILGALGRAGFREAHRFVQGGVLSEYRALR